MLRAFDQSIQHMSQHHTTMLQDVALKCCERLARPVSGNRVVNENAKKVKKEKIIVLRSTCSTHFSTNSCGTLHNNDVKSPNLRF